MGFFVEAGPLDVFIPDFVRFTASSCAWHALQHPLPCRPVQQMPEGMEYDSATSSWLHLTTEEALGVGNAVTFRVVGAEAPGQAGQAVGSIAGPYLGLTAGG